MNDLASEWDRRPAGWQEWRVGAAWTHPSLQDLTTTEMRAKVAELRSQTSADANLYADHPGQRLVCGLLSSNRQRICNYEIAIADREARGFG